MTRTSALLLTSLALALPATASADGGPKLTLPDPIPVPAGQVQHTVTDATFTSNITIPGKSPWHHVSESWAASDQSRTVVTDADSGALLSECTTHGKDYACYSPSRNTVTTGQGSGSDLGASWAYNGALIQAQIDAGSLRVTGAATFLGRPVKTLQYTSGNDGASSVLADAETGYPLQRITDLTDNGQHVRQVSAVTTFEVLDPATAAPSLVMSDHTGATVARASVKHKKVIKRKKATKRHNKKAAARR